MSYYNSNGGLERDVDWLKDYIMLYPKERKYYAVMCFGLVFCKNNRELSSCKDCTENENCVMRRSMLGVRLRWYRIYLRNESSK